MKPIDVYYQGEGLGEIQHMEVDHEATFAIVKSRLREKHGITVEVLLFVEDHEQPIDDACYIKEHVTHAGLKLHLHRCHAVEVTVMFNGETLEHRFSPAATVAKVKHWAAVTKLGMTPAEAGEHELQIAGTHIRPTLGTHIGALTDGRVCGLAFDLVPNERINGATEVAP